MTIDNKIIEQLAPDGVLRVGLNMANFLLITGRHSNGEPEGVSPDVGRRIANELGVGIKFIEYEGPGDVADAAPDNAWDIGNIAAEAERAKVINFSPAYCEIQATYMLPPGSALTSVEDVDQSGIRIAVKERAAYDLFLTEHLKHATLVRTPSIDDSFNVFQDDELDVLAGLRPALLTQQTRMPGAIILEQSFAAVQQSIGCQPGKPDAANYLKDFVIRSISDGLIAKSIERHDVVGKLSVAPLPDST